MVTQRLLLDQWVEKALRVCVPTAAWPVALPCIPGQRRLSMAEVTAPGSSSGGLKPFSQTPQKNSSFRVSSMPQQLLDPPGSTDVTGDMRN